MNIVKRLDQYKDDCLFFCEPIKNNIMTDGNFIRILYSNNKFTLNGIYLFFTLNDISFEKYYNKYKCIFNISSHKELIDQIKVIEENILNKIEFKNKFSQHKIYEQFKNGYIKIFQEIQNNSDIDLILKISGIWEINSSFGLTYKFIKINDET